MTDFRYLSDTFAVSAQITPAEVAEARAQGFAGIVCNRPDGEASGQPTIAEIEQAAADQGLSFRAIPVGAAGISADDIAGTLGVMASGEKTLAYCRTGTRSTILHALARATAGDPVETIIADASKAGYDLAPYRSRLVATAEAKKD